MTTARMLKPVVAGRLPNVSSLYGPKTYLSRNKKRSNGPIKMLQGAKIKSSPTATTSLWVGQRHDARWNIPESFHGDDWTGEVARFRLTLRSLREIERAQPDTPVLIGSVAGRRQKVTSQYTFLHYCLWALRLKQATTS